MRYNFFLDLIYSNSYYICCFLLIELGYKIVDFCKNKRRHNPSGDYGELELSHLYFRITISKFLFIVFNYFVICLLQFNGTLNKELWEIGVFSIFFLVSGILFSLYIVNSSWFNLAYDINIVGIKYGTAIVIESNPFYSILEFDGKKIEFNGLISFLLLLNKEFCKIYFLEIKDGSECKVLVSLKPHVCSICGFVNS